MLLKIQSSITRQKRFRPLYRSVFFASFSCLLLLIFNSCISPVNIDPDTPSNALVVDGFITTDFGPHEISLSRLTRFASTLEGGTIFPEDDAVVFITDDQGNRVDLTRKETVRKEISNVCPPGIPCCNPVAFFFPTTAFPYTTPETFRAEVGRTYVLNIIVRGGLTYQSSPQTVIPSPAIDSVSFNFVRLPSTDPLDVGTGVDVFVTWTDPVEQANFYSWRINGTYRLETPATPANSCCFFDPADGGASLCWIEERDVQGNELAFSDSQINGTSLTRKIGFVEDNGLRFANTNVSGDRQYFVEVEQLATSREAFAFNRLFASQLDIDGDIFDPPPSEIRGNVNNVNDPEELVIGFFGAYSIAKKGAFINRDILEEVQPWTNPCGDCRLRAGSTTEVPAPFRQ